MCVYGINYFKQIKDNETRLAASVGVPGGVAVGGLTGIGIFNLVGSIALAPATGGFSLVYGAAATVGVGVGVAATVDAVGEYDEINNNKGSTIKPSNEMNESNNKLGERENRLSD